MQLTLLRVSMMGGMMRQTAYLSEGIYEGVG